MDEALTSIQETSIEIRKRGCQNFPRKSFVEKEIEPYKTLYSIYCRRLKGLRGFTKILWWKLVMEEVLVQ